MADQKRELNIQTIVTLCVILPLIGFILLEIFFPTTTWQVTQVHIILESLGLFSGFALAIFILSTNRTKKTVSWQVWAASALIAMGILDGFHSAILGGTSAGWLHSLAMLIGGFLFAMVWLRDKGKYSENPVLIPAIVAGVVIILGVCIVFLPERLPLMLVHNTFSMTSIVVNLLGGIFFISGAAALFTRHMRKSHENEELFFAGFCLLNGMAAFMFPVSLAWSASFWFWHLLRVFAYILLFLLIYDMYRSQELLAEGRLKESEERFRTMVEQSPLSIQILSLEGRTVQVNHAFEKLWGITLEDLKQYNILSDHQLVELGLMEYIKKGFAGEAVSIPSVQYDVIKSVGKGEKRWVESRIYPVRDRWGSISNVIIVHEDITERKQAEMELIRSNEELHAAYEQISATEEELRANYEELSIKEQELRQGEQKFRAIFDQTFQFIGLLTPDGTIREVNRTALEFGGIHESDVIGRPLWKTPWLNHSTDQQEKIRNAVKDAARGVFVRFETNHLAPDGSLHYIDFSLKPVMDDEGHVVLLIPEGRDITERKQAEDALDQARKKLSFLNSIAFMDIQNAIFSLSGYLELGKEIPMDEKLRQNLDKQSEIVRTITESLKFANNYQNLGLKSPTWQNVMQTFLYGISHLDLSALSRRLDLKGLEIYADPLLENVFFTFAENVVLHGKTATEIALWYRDTPEGLTLYFEDNGVGIPEDMKDNIFDRRYEEKKGIGLFLTREILSITGITLKETGEPGKGARFEIMVPGKGYRFTEDDGTGVSVFE